MTTTLDALISEIAERVGVERACRALGTSPRSYRHRQQDSLSFVNPLLAGLKPGFSVR